MSLRSRHGGSLTQHRRVLIHDDIRGHANIRLQGLVEREDGETRDATPELLINELRRLGPNSQVLNVLPR